MRALFLFLLIWPAFGAVAFVRQATPVSATAATSVAVTIVAAANGNTLFAFSVGGNTAGGATRNTVASVASTNTTWAKLTSTVLDAGYGLEIWRGNVSGGSSGTTVTITYNSGATHVAGSVAEFSGIPTTWVADTPPVTAIGTSTTPAIGAFSVRQTGDFVLIADGHENGTAPTSSPTSPWIMLTGKSTGSTLYESPGYQIGAASGATTASWTITSLPWGTLVVALGPPLTAVNSGPIGFGRIP